MQVEKILTKEQQIIITNIINKQYYDFIKLEDGNPNIFDKDYSKCRGADITAILSGFTPDKKIPGINIEKEKYNRNGLTQPKLILDNGTVIHIYRNNNSLDSDFIKVYCKQYNQDINTIPIYCCILFGINEKGVNKIELAVPNHNGEIIEKYPLYEIYRRNIASA